MVEFQVLRCAECQTFQVLQVTKSLKWKCKLCGSKQSVIKVYGRGTGSDCRKHVQKLNRLRGEIDLLKEDASFSPAASAINKIVGDNLSQQETINSRWSKFVEDPVLADDTPTTDDASADENTTWVTTDRELYDRERKQATVNKRRWGFSEEYQPRESTFGIKRQNRGTQRWRKDSHFDNSSLSSKANSIPVNTSDFHTKDKVHSKKSDLQVLHKNACNMRSDSAMSGMSSVYNGKKSHGDCAIISSGDNKNKQPSLSHWGQFMKEHGPENKFLQKQGVTKFNNSSSTALKSKWNSFLDDDKDDNVDSDDDAELTLSLSHSGQLAMFLPVTTGGDVSNL